MWLIVCGSHTRHSYMREKLAKGEITNEQMLQYLGIKPNKHKEDNKIRWAWYWMYFYTLTYSDYEEFAKKIYISDIEYSQSDFENIIL